MKRKNFIYEKIKLTHLPTQQNQSQIPKQVCWKSNISFKQKLKKSIPNTKHLQKISKTKLLLPLLVAFYRLVIHLAISYMISV
jgi:hypothetical protein